ncbi:PGM_PMM_I domain-containing protein [Cephalotus follicularis]|uniref:PGM_PMM_I domain-containing protein n=1 Tax=Cephalotus follicularis TaxID=3775 RepID=A0A1Q3CH61_CEPFO|nr:PGM_PMM_I domain-containing protein [Cephalotus follicularis]
MFNSTLRDDDAFLCPVDRDVMITASHLPYDRNGFKFFTSVGEVDNRDMLKRAADMYNNFTDEGLMDKKRRASASVKRVDYMTVYRSDLVKAVHKDEGNIGKGSSTSGCHHLYFSENDIIFFLQHPGTTIVTDSAISDCLTKVID